MNSGFWKAGHTPTLLASFLYFDVSFMVWVLLGPLAIQIATDLHLTSAQKGLMVATPMLAGAMFRIVMGVLVDHLKPKKAGAIGQLIVMAALMWAWLAGVDSYQKILVLGIFLGVAGAAFAVAFHSLRAGTRRSIRALHLASPAQVIPARCSPRCLRPRWRSFSVGMGCLV